MNNVRKKLIDKIERDTGFIINNNWSFERPNLSWAHKSAGRMIWYWYTNNGIVAGSSEKMTDLLKSHKITMYTDHYGFIDFSSS